MKRLLLTTLLAAFPAVGLWCLPAIGLAQDELDERIVGEEQEGVELLARGPVHEAFAEPIVENPSATLTVDRQPPEAIDEVPPEYKPGGDNVVWIPGYWAWDDEHDDFIWISGIWRNIPPGQRWVPGYWTEVNDGYQWVPGFWMSDEEEEIVYYPTPPETLEQGPTAEAPDDNHFWVPGVWVYETDWRWRPGYWAAYQPDWLWVPARWVWTPRGCIYLTGYWDYQPVSRGCLFAPVYFSEPVYRTRGWRYSPWYALRTPNLFVHFWVRPNYRHYYFGNFYAREYRRYGIQPWITWGSSRHAWDPLLTYNRVHYRREGVDYVRRMERWHDYFVTNTRYRPAPTVRQQAVLMASANIRNNRDLVNQINLGSPLRDIARSQDAAIRFDRIQDRQRDQYQERAAQIRDIHRARLEQERRDTRERVADARDAADRPEGPRGTARIPRVDVADLTSARDAATRVRVPDRLDPGRTSEARDVAERRREAVNRARDAAQRSRDTAGRTSDATGDRARDAAARARDAARDRVGEAGERTRDAADVARDRLDANRDAAARAREMADRARDRAGDRGTETTRDVLERARDSAAATRDRARSAADRTGDAASRTREGVADSTREALDRSRDRANRPGVTPDRTRDAADATRAALERTREAARQRTADAAARTRELGDRSATDRAVPNRGTLDRPRGAEPRSVAPARPGPEAAPRPRGGNEPRSGARRDPRGASTLPADRAPAATREPGIGRAAFGGPTNDAPGSTIRSRTPSPYRGANDRPAAANRREVLRPSVGGTGGAAANPGAGADRSRPAVGPSGRPTPSGMDLYRLQGGDRSSVRDNPGQRPSMGVGNARNSPGVGGPGRGTAGPSRGADRPVSDGPGAGGPDDRARPRAR